MANILYIHIKSAGVPCVRTTWDVRWQLGMSDRPRKKIDISSCMGVRKLKMASFYAQMAGACIKTKNKWCLIEFFFLKIKNWHPFFWFIFFMKILQILIHWGHQVMFLKKLNLWICLKIIQEFRKTYFSCPIINVFFEKLKMWGVPIFPYDPHYKDRDNKKKFFEKSYLKNQTTKLNENSFGLLKIDWSFIKCHHYTVENFSMQWFNFFWQKLQFFGLLLEKNSKNKHYPMKPYVWGLKLFTIAF